MSELAVAAIALAALLYQQRRHAQEVAKVIAFAESIVEAGARERSELATRIQAPEVAPSLSAPDPSGEMLHVPYDDDGAWDEYIEARENGLVN